MVPELHDYPFTSLPYLKSHVRPQFAIYNAGEKLVRALGMQNDLIKSSQDIADLKFVMELHDAWKRLPPPTHKKDQTYFSPKPPGPSPDNVDDSNDDSNDDYVDLVD